jgi:hypothetical protein
MADSYIDEREASEYGEYFYSESKKLEGLSEVFVISKLREKFRALLDAYQRERSASAGGLVEVRKTAEEATTEAREVLTRFFSFLGSLKSGSIDKEAFFKKGKLGDVQKLKPADVQTKLETVLLGFSTKENQSFKEREEWQRELTSALELLAASLLTKESKRTDATRKNTAKGDRFDKVISFYTNVAKSAVSGLLFELERSSEYKLFFKDLQVSETTKDKKNQQEGAKKAAETKKSAKSETNADPA